VAAGLARCWDAWKRRRSTLVRRRGRRGRASSRVGLRSLGALFARAVRGNLLFIVHAAPGVGRARSCLREKGNTAHRTQRLPGGKAGTCHIWTILNRGSDGRCGLDSDSINPVWNSAAATLIARLGQTAIRGGAHSAGRSEAESARAGSSRPGWARDHRCERCTTKNGLEPTRTFHCRPRLMHTLEDSSDRKQSRRACALQ
jgi:hypothetical protein